MMKPLYDRVVVRQKEEEDVTAGGIVLAGTAKEKPLQGEVIAVGEGHLLDDGTVKPLSVEPGDTIVFGKAAGKTVEVDGEELLVMVESEIYGILNESRAS